MPLIDEKTLKQYTFLGAQVRLQQIDKERAEIFRVYPQLNGHHSKRKMSKATRAKLSKISQQKWKDPLFRKKQEAGRARKRA